MSCKIPLSTASNFSIVSARNDNKIENIVSRSIMVLLIAENIIEQLGCQ